MKSMSSFRHLGTLFLHGNECVLAWECMVLSLANCECRDVLSKVVGCAMRSLVSLYELAWGLSVSNRVFA